MPISTMADLSPPLLISVTPSSPSLTLALGVDPFEVGNETLELEGNYFNTTYQEPGVILDPPEVDILSPVPPLPEYLRDGDPLLPFNHLLLPRLQNTPSKVFSLNIHQTLIYFSGVDFSNALYSLDWQTPINGVAQGVITLKETLGLSIDPDSNGITQGSEVEIYIKETPTTEDLLVKCYVLGFPSLSLSQSGTYELQIEIGDELALLSQTTRNRSLYCGPKPRTTQELANIFASLNGLKTRLFPTGHDIVETSINNFLTDSPFEFLSKIYSPVNRDIRTLPNSAIIAPTRRSFDDSRSLTLSYKDVIQSQNNFSQYYETYTTIKVSNDFPLELPFGFTTRSFTQINGNPENDKPWFQGGYQEIRTTITSLGDTDIYYLKETFGYVPTESTPWAKALVDSDPCAIGGFTTIFDVIETEIKSLTYYPHPSGSKVVSKEETWVNGLKVFQIKDTLDPDFEDYDLYNGVLSYVVTTYSNIPQINIEVCEKEYQLLTLNLRTENYAVDSEFNFLFRSWSQENYSSSGVSFNLGQTSFTGVGIRWTKVIQEGEFSETENLWIIQPPREESNSNPPQAKIIKAVVETVTNFSQFSLIPGSEPIEPKPLSAPMCYTQVQLNVIGNRYLREQYGLSKSIVITVPFSNTLNLNDSVYFTDRLGQTNKYLCYDIETNITLTQCTKTITLLRHYE